MCRDKKGKVRLEKHAEITGIQHCDWQELTMDNSQYEIRRTSVMTQHQGLNTKHAAIEDHTPKYMFDCMCGMLDIW